MTVLCCKALENGSSCEEVERNTRLRPVFPPKLLSWRRRFLRALQWNRAQSRLLYFLIIGQFVVCPHLTQWQRNVPSSILGGTYIFLFSLLFPFFFFFFYLFFFFIYILPIVVLFCIFIYVFFSLFILFILFPIAFSYFPVFLITSCRSSEEQRQNLRLTYF